VDRDGGREHVARPIDGLARTYSISTSSGTPCTQEVAVDVMLIDPAPVRGEAATGGRRRRGRRLGYPGLGIYTVAALTPPEATVIVVDESTQPIPNASHPDLVGISVQAPTAPHAYELAARMRSSGIPVVLGGIHVTLNPEEAAEHADAIVVGEAEATWPDVVRDAMNGRLEPRYDAPGPVPLDSSPPPRRDLMPHGRHTPWAIQATKGCPFDCEFCSLAAVGHRRLRRRSVERVVEEIRTLPGDPVLFVDDNLYADRAYSRQLFEALIPLRRSWVGEATWHLAFDEELLHLTRASGCEGLFVGFDSINQQHRIRKVPGGASPESTYVEAMRRIAGAGIGLVAAFVFGLDADDSSVFERSLEVIREGGAHMINLSVLVPYPGTPIFERFAREGRITEWDWGRYVSPHVCFEPKRMTAQELGEGTLWAQKEFFALPRILRTAARTTHELGWGRGLLALQLNLAQRRNWPHGTFGAGQA
jgi:radical SAM superfamily enzyme YgiQ (UPF0313 family)